MHADDIPELGPPKGLPPHAPADLAEIPRLGWNAFTANFHLPMAVLLESAIRHNSATMAAFCLRRGVSLAPHGKTTMAPDLFRIQLEDGAWAISAATVWQARTMKAAGVPRVLIANEVVTAPEIRWLGEVSGGDDGFEVLCFVDSLDAVRLMERVLAENPPRRPVAVLVELGFIGGRTGARTIKDALEVALAVRDARYLELRGTAGFEGIILAERDGRPARDLAQEYLQDVHRLTVQIDQAGGFSSVAEVIVTAGGSAWFDLVAEEFARIRIGRPVRPVVRSGCYLTHDDGGYDPVFSPMGSSARVAAKEGRLRAALEVWGAVLSRPEPTRAIVGIGKRDISPDAGPPRVRGARRANGAAISPMATVTALNDQHAYLELQPDSPLAVGDLVALGVPHPCTTFDKWRVIPMVDDNYRIRRMVRTYF